jgi:flagellar L-ring protein precursor FlgH
MRISSVRSLRVGMIACATLLLALPAIATDKKPKKPAEPTAVDKYVAAAAQQSEAIKPTAGAIWTPASPFAELGRDVRASQVNDLVTIVVAESTSAVASGVTKTQRQSSYTNSIAALAKPTNPTGALANLANLSSNMQLNGQGTTSRQTSITTTMSARVAAVLPNGYLVVEGIRQINVNSEHQTITVRGVVRPADLAPDNSVPSNRLAQMDIQLDGKGVVGDAIKRPFILYRLLMGFLPF